MKKRFFKTVLSMTLAFAAVAGVPQMLAKNGSLSLTAEASGYARTAGAYRVRQGFYIPFASESTYYLWGKNYNQGDIIVLDDAGWDQYGINLLSRGYVDSYYLTKMY
ncbi:MAG: hypothetical protein IKI77_01840 [Oscillospiraceae bacterium]|nr:hypothetical protein [Oscillospiraceae bacterium]